MEDGSGGDGSIFSVKREEWGSKAGLVWNIYSILRTTEKNSGFGAMNFLIGFTQMSFLKTHFRAFIVEQLRAI